jgi:dihydrofolate reductase
MRSVTYSMAVSLDGYIAGPDGKFDWSIPDEELMRFATDETRQVGVQLMGRKLYETMLYWETVDQASLEDSDLEWIAIWKPLPKVVFSATLPAVQGSARLASNLRRLRAHPAERGALIPTQLSRNVTTSDSGARGMGGWGSCGSA